MYVCIMIECISCVFLSSGIFQVGNIARSQGARIRQVLLYVFMIISRTIRCCQVVQYHISAVLEIESLKESLSNYECANIH